MSKRNALAELSKALPSSEEIEATLDQLRAESDIAAAITGAAIIEARLEMLLKSKMPSADANLQMQLFENRGPMSDFNSKILVAQALGCITRPMASELHTIRSVRNAFAHAKLSLSFSHSVVEQKARSFKMIAAMKAAAPEGRDFEEFPSTKAGFLLVVRLLLILFETIGASPGTANEAIRAALK